MWKEFRAFIFKGNVVDLAVAVVIGAAFGAVITSLTKDILTPLIAAIVGKPDFSRFHLVLNNSNITYGLFINALIAFILIGAAVYFFVVAPMNSMLRRLHGPAADTPPTTKKCPECLSDIPVEARRCAHCAQPVGPATAAPAS